MTMTRRFGLSLALTALFSAATAGAGDVYVVRFDTTGGPPVLAEPPCTYLTYRDDLVFYNAGESDATIGFLGTSNGSASNPLPLTVEAGSTRSSAGDSSAASTWAPDPRPLRGLWVAHLEVPDEVQVLSRLLAISGEGPACTGGFPGGATHDYAGIAMPVVRTLTPARVAQVHLGTDIGGNGAGSDDGRVNIGIYNAGAATARATAELRRACDGSLLEARTAVIASNTIVQLNSFSGVFTGCSAIRTAAYETYVVVTVDQPSFSYVITLSNKRPPWIPVSSSR
jgi:hypothetical protein